MASSGTAIAVEGLSKRFGSVVALDGLNFEVQSGTVFGLLGPNGAGKTTAIRVLTTILPPDSGRAEVLGYDVARNPEAVRYRIGLAGQFAAVDPNLTGRENLRLMGRLAQLSGPTARQRADELLQRFELADAANRPVRTYSGGMRRRLDIAAALAPRPPVLFLDEPTTGLDPHSRNALWDMIRELVAGGTTVLLTTQYMEEADRLAARIAVVGSGKVIAEGTPADLKRRLGNSVIEIGLPDAGAGARARAVLAGLAPGGPAGDGPQLDGATVRFPGTDGAKSLIEVLRALDAQGLSPATLVVREPSLDDVFLKLTGRHAEPLVPVEKPTGSSGGAR